MGLVFVPASYAAEPSKVGVTRTQIEGVDDVGWNDTPHSSSTITCLGGELVIDPFARPCCSDSSTGSLHFRDGAAWSCIKSNDPRMTCVSLNTSSRNFDTNSV